MAKGKGKQFKIPATLFNKDFWDKFARVAKNEYKHYIFNNTNPRMSNDKPFPEYSTKGENVGFRTINKKKVFIDSYANRKKAGKLFRQDQSYANSKAPYVVGDLSTDTDSSSDAKNNAIYIGWNAHANKVKWLRDMNPKRILTSKAHPFPKKVTEKKLMKLFNQHLKKVMPKGTRTTTIGKKK